MNQDSFKKYVNSKKILLSGLLLLLIAPVFCSCSPQGEPSMKKEIKQEVTAITVGPVKELDHEEHISSVNNLLDAVVDSYGKMNASVNESTDKDAINAAKNVEKLYGARIEELKQADFSTWSEEDLFILSSELSNMITAIREARDLLNFQ